MMYQVSSPFTSKKRHLSNSGRDVDRRGDGNWHYYKYVADRGIWFLLVSIPYQYQTQSLFKKKSIWDASCGRTLISAECLFKHLLCKIVRLFFMVAQHFEKVSKNSHVKLDLFKTESWVLPIIYMYIVCVCLYLNSKQCCPLVVFIIHRKPMSHKETMGILPQEEARIGSQKFLSCRNWLPKPSYFLCY